MRFPLVVCVFVGAVQTALAAEFTGFIIDNVCWELANHIGFDGAVLDSRPQDHWLHCLLLSICKPGGYALLEEYDDSGTTKYRIKYQLDDAGDAAAIRLFEEIVSTDKDRQLTEQVTVVGELGMDGLTIVTTSIALASSGGGGMSPPPVASPPAGSGDSSAPIVGTSEATMFFVMASAAYTLLS